jgi:hypothetical protein
MFLFIRLGKTTMTMKLHWLLIAIACCLGSGCLYRTVHREIATLAPGMHSHESLRAELPMSGTSWWLALRLPDRTLGSDTEARRIAIRLTNLSSNDLTVFQPTNPSIVVQPGQRILVWKGSVHQVLSSLRLFGLQANRWKVSVLLELEFDPEWESKEPIKILASKSDAI